VSEGGIACFWDIVGLLRGQAEVMVGKDEDLSIACMIEGRIDGIFMALVAYAYSFHWRAPQQQQLQIHINTSFQRAQKVARLLSPGRLTETDT
jgi:hypothetical protein